jgi:ADP-ribosylglycohydrolase
MEKYTCYDDLFILEEKNGTVNSPLINLIIHNKLKRDELNKYSIFYNRKGDLEIEKSKEYVKNLLNDYIKKGKMEKLLNTFEDGAIGSMLGMTIGDAMGHRFEFLPVVYNKIYLTDMGKGEGGKFRLLPGQWTDDTSMGLCLADSLIVNKGKFNAHDLMHRFLGWWYGGYNNAFRRDISRINKNSVGLGGIIKKSFESYLEYPLKETCAGDKNSSGNGSIMRNTAVPICFHNDINKAMEIAKAQSLVTHKGIEAAECCRLLTFIIVKILNRKNEKLNDILDNLTDFKTSYNSNSVKYLVYSMQENNDPDRNWNWKYKYFSYSPNRTKENPGYIGSYAMDAMAMALHIVYNTKTFYDAIIKAVNLRGDSDSVGAVVGQIAGAYYGVSNIPPTWIKTIYQWDNYEIATRGYMLLNINQKKNEY